MRKRVAVVTVVALLALVTCGKDSGTNVQPKASITFRVDAGTCTGSGSIALTVDNDSYIHILVCG
jgi:hypothetical protein